MNTKDATTVKELQLDDDVFYEDELANQPHENEVTNQVDDSSKPDMKEIKLVTIHNQNFADREAASNYYRNILLKYSSQPSITPLNQEEMEMVISLLKAGHPDFNKKIGVGVKHVIVKHHPKHQNTKCFVIVRTDGSEEDFSYLKCLDTLFGEIERNHNKEKTFKRKGFEEKRKYKANCTIEIKGIPPDKASQEQLKDLFRKFGNIIRISLNIREYDAKIAFSHPEQAANALSSLNGDPISGSLLTGEQEEKWWSKQHKRLKYTNKARSARNKETLSKSEGQKSNHVVPVKNQLPSGITRAIPTAAAAAASRIAGPPSIKTTSKRS